MRQPGRRVLVRGIALVAVLLVLICSILWIAWRAIESERNARAELDDALALQRASLELKFRSADVSGWQTAYALDLTRGAAKLSEEAPRRQSFTSAARQFERQLRTIGALPLTAAERRHLGTAREAFTAFMRIDAEVQSAFRRGGSEDVAHANDLVMGAAITYFGKATEAIDQLVALIQEHANEATRRATQKSDRARELLAFAGSLALLLTAVLAFFLYRSFRANARVVAKLESEARTDALTGVANRRTWSERLPREREQSRRFGYPIAVALLDLDHFKKFNDTFGHPSGDRQLADTAAAWQAALRQGDLIARYGGEEFALLLPGCNAPCAEIMIERLRPLVPEGQTFSAGVASWNGEERPEALLRRADQALYRAKAMGRNCTVPAAEAEMRGTADRWGEEEEGINPQWG